MSPSMLELYRTGLLLAKELGESVQDVPKTFQLNELEDYVQRKTHEVALKRAVALNDAEAAAEAETDGPTDKR